MKKFNTFLLITLLTAPLVSFSMNNEDNEKCYPSCCIWVLGTLFGGLAANLYNQINHQEALAIRDADIQWLQNQINTRNNSNACLAAFRLGIMDTYSQGQQPLINPEEAQHCPSLGNRIQRSLLYAKVVNDWERLQKEQSAKQEKEKIMKRD